MLSAQGMQQLKVAVVGDTGIGDRVFHPGFNKVMQGIRSQKPDVLMHLGDFIYQSQFMPGTCNKNFLKIVKSELADPFPQRVFVPGDNDFPPHKWKPKASGCWDQIDPLDNPFDQKETGAFSPRSHEGTLQAGPVLFVVLNAYPWEDPAPWLAPRIEEARKEGLWVIVGLHDPALTTAWFRDKRDTVLKQINSLQPDLVLSGNQHSYERFHALGIPSEDSGIPFTRPTKGQYRKGQGTIHIISGGGGATFKMFADWAGVKKRTAPKPVFDALASRALMNHFLVLRVEKKQLKVETHRVCPQDEPGISENPRWRSKDPKWQNVTLECDGKEPGITLFEEFSIVRE